MDGAVDVIAWMDLMNHTPYIRRILCIDDCPVSLVALESHLSPYYRVVLAQDCKTGFAASKTNRPDVILLDMEFEQTTGIELLKLLAQDADLMELPVIIVSSCASRYVGRFMHFTNITGVLNKPVSAKELRTAIRTALDATFVNQFKSTSVSV